jgi:hypothetical protein
VGKWPWPEDTATERARRIANSLLALLPADERPAWVARAHSLGETWLGETLVVHADDEAITGPEAAAMLSVSEDTIRQWAARSLLPRFGWRGRRRTYLVADLFSAAAASRRRQP